MRRGGKDDNTVEQVCRQEEKNQNVSSSVCGARDGQTEECMVVIPDGPFIGAVLSHDGGALRCAEHLSARLRRTCCRCSVATVRF